MLYEFDIPERLGRPIVLLSSIDNPAKLVLHQVAALVGNLAKHLLAPEVSALLHMCSSCGAKCFLPLSEEHIKTRLPAD